MLDMNTSERQPIKVEGVVAHHKAEIPMGRPKEIPKVTLLVTQNSGSTLAGQHLDRSHPYTARGELAQTVFNRLLMRDLLTTGTPVVITYDPAQPVPKSEEGWIINSISVPGKTGQENVLIDLTDRSPKN